MRNREVIHLLEERSEREREKISEKCLKINKNKMNEKKKLKKIEKKIKHFPT